MKPGSKGWKKFMAKLYGIGAAIVIVGALFKIMHWPFSGPLLVVGLLTEAVIFFFSAFEPLHEDPDWSLVYPELATGEHGDGDHLPISKGGTVTEQLDDMLIEAKIEPDLIASLGDGMRQLSTQAEKLKDISDASVATEEYTDSLKDASSKVSTLADTYANASESLTGIADNAEAGANTGEHLKKMGDNLVNLNQMYELQLQEMEKTRSMYAGMGELVQNLNDSVADTQRYKESIKELSTNLESLNRVYANMLNAMNGTNS